MARRLALVLLLALLAGCGWHLRGGGQSPQLAGARLYLDVQPAVSNLRPEVVRGLRLGGADLAEQAEGAARLVLLAEEVQRRPAAVSSDARVQEYELNYGLSYRLEAADGGVLIAPEVIRASELYDYDPGNVLSAQSREAQLLERLRQDAVRRVLARVKAALAQGSARAPAS